MVNPTWDEPFGRTALESSSRGCAVITSVSGGLSETFNNNLILKKNNVSNLFNLLDKLIQNPNLARKLSKKAKNLSRKYSWEKCSNETFSLIRNMINIMI